jgi:hypothetical protein
MQSHKNINFLVLKFLSPLFIITGIAGYFLPQEKIIISNEAFYNLFHIDAGLIGIIILLTYKVKLVRSYNIFLGVIYLYQAFASYYKIFPDQVFKYTITDDIIHLDIGLTLILIGIIAKRDIEDYEGTSTQKDTSKLSS